MAPAVSVVIPTHNRATTIRASLESVLAQRFVKLEVIIVDDASTDETIQVLESFDDERVRTLRLPENVGAAEARNIGIAAATGDLIAFQDSDDLWHPEKLVKQVQAMQRADAAWSICMVELVDLDGRHIGIRPDHSELARIRRGAGSESLVKDNFVATPALVVRASALRDVGGFWAELPRFQDWELALRLADLPLAVVERVLVTAHRQPTSISRNDQLLAPALTMLLDRHRERFAQDLPALAFRLHQRSVSRQRSTAETFFDLLDVARTSPRYAARLVLRRLTGRDEGD